MAIIVVTGVDGFVGRHVVDAVISAGHVAWGVTRQPIVDPELRSRLGAVATADLREEWPADFFGDAVIHLAGLAAVGPSFTAPQLYIESNSSMVTNLCEALLEAERSDVHIVGISSGAVYDTRQRHVVDESAATSPTSPYVVSKLLVETQLTYYRGRGLHTTVARPFNHIGPGQSAGFLVPDLTRRLLGGSVGDPLTVGSLEARRDYTDVRDVARAYVDLALLPDAAPIYNIASGASHSGREVLDLVCAALGRPVPPTRTDPSLIRPNDPADGVGDATLLRSTGWHPTIGLQQSIEDFLSPFRR